MNDINREPLSLPPEQQEQVVEILRVLQSARDAVNDDMIGRLATVMSESLDTLDRFNRSGITDALPVISQFVASGDLQRALSLARLIAAVEDSLSDDMVSRLSWMFSEGLSVLDRLTRNGALENVLQILIQPEVQAVLVRFGEALAKANTEFDTMPHPKGGFGGLLKMGTDRGNQEALQFMGLFGKHLLNGHH